jgi:hypothetical protein
MRFSVQFERYRQMYGGAEPPYPKGAVVCYWFKRRAGTIGERVDVVLSPAACRHFRIWAPMALGKERAERIELWNRKQAMREWS